MADEKATPRDLVPPYIAYATFKTLLDRLRGAPVPNRIDRSVMHTFSGGVQSQLDAALRFLGLITEAKIPTPRLEKIAAAQDETWKPLFASTVKAAYAFIFADGLDLERATTQQLQERFIKAGAGGDTVRKCMTFFLNAAKETGIPISPYIKVSKSAAPASKRKRPKAPNKPGADPGNDDDDVETSETETWEDKLLKKFPDFDPSWSPDVQKAWFDAFQKLHAQMDGE